MIPFVPIPTSYTLSRLKSSNLPQRSFKSLSENLHFKTFDKNYSCQPFASVSDFRSKIRRPTCQLLVDVDLFRFDIFDHVTSAFASNGIYKKMSTKIRTLVPKTIDISSDWRKLVIGEVKPRVLLRPFTGRALEFEFEFEIVSTVARPRLVALSFQCPSVWMSQCTLSVLSITEDN